MLKGSAGDAALPTDFKTTTDKVELFDYGAANEKITHSTASTILSSTMAQKYRFLASRTAPNDRRMTYGVKLLRPNCRHSEPSQLVKRLWCKA